MRNNRCYRIRKSHESNYSFLESLLEYNQTYTWFFRINDTAGNVVQTGNYTFTVEDRTAPSITNVIQNNPNPQYNENNTALATISEPTDASRIDTILFYYENHSSSGKWIDITTTSNYTFLESLLEYDQTYTWFFWANDTAANHGQTANFSFTVEDRSIPNIIEVTQTNPTPEYDENNTVSIVVTEPADASGIDTILLYYENDSGSGIWEDVTSKNNYTFLENILEYIQNYTWFFWINDTAGNSVQANNFTFSIEDRTAPNIIDITQSSPTPQYNENNTASIVVTEPSDASGLNKVLFL